MRIRLKKPGSQLFFREMSIERRYNEVEKHVQQLFLFDVEKRRPAMRFMIAVRSSQYAACFVSQFPLMIGEKEAHPN